MATDTVNTQIIVCPQCATPNRVVVGRALTQSSCGSCKQSLSSSTPIDIGGELLTKLTARDQGAFVVDIWAPWCGPCRQFAPAFEAAAAQFGEHVRFFKINADDHGGALQPFGVRGIPTILAWNGGRQVAQQAGAMSQPQLFRWIGSTFELSLS